MPWTSCLVDLICECECLSFLGGDNVVGDRAVDEELLVLRRLGERVRDLRPWRTSTKTQHRDENYRLKEIKTT